MINLIKSDLYRIFKGKANLYYISYCYCVGIVSCVGMSSSYIGVSTNSKLTSFDKESTIALNEVKQLNRISKYYKKSWFF